LQNLLSQKLQLVIGGIYVRSRKSTEARKEEIVRAALTIIEQKGLDTLNINDIAEEIKLVPSAIYRHFRGKEEIIATLIEYTDRRLKHNLSQATAFEGTVIHKLKLLFELHVKLLSEEAAIPRILYFILNSDRNSELNGNDVVFDWFLRTTGERVVASGARKARDKAGFGHCGSRDAIFGNGATPGYS